MNGALAVSYVVHVFGGLAWLGAVAYAAVILLPAARAGGLTAAGLARTVDRLLQTTRLTGVLLPATGLYQLWQLYPHSLGGLTGTTRGWLVLAMATLWGLTNGAVELAVYRMRIANGAGMGLARHTVSRFSLDDEANVTALVTAARPYVLTAAGLAVVLLVDAALLVSCL